MDITHLVLVCAAAIFGIFVVYWLLEHATIDPAKQKIAVLAVIIVIVLVVVFLLRYGDMGGTAIRVP